MQLLDDDGGETGETIKIAGLVFFAILRAVCLLRPKLHFGCRP
jgi:hypothetical protein